MNWHMILRRTNNQNWVLVLATQSTSEAHAKYDEQCLDAAQNLNEDGFADEVIWSQFESDQDLVREFCRG